MLRIRNVRALNVLQHICRLMHFCKVIQQLNNMTDMENVATTTVTPVKFSMDLVLFVFWDKDNPVNVDRSEINGNQFYFLRPVTQYTGESFYNLYKV